MGRETRERFPGQFCSESVLLGRHSHPSTQTISFISSLRQVKNGGEKQSKEEGGRERGLPEYISFQHTVNLRELVSCPLASHPARSLSSLLKSLNVSGPRINSTLPSSLLICPHYVPSMNAIMLLWKSMKRSVLSVWYEKSLKKKSPCPLLPARMAAALPNLMKDCHQVYKCLSNPKVRDCLTCCCIT